jgi:hypothetical protein
MKNILKFSTIEALNIIHLQVYMHHLFSYNTYNWNFTKYTNHMEESPWEGYSSLPCQEISAISWNPPLIPYMKKSTTDKVIFNQEQMDVLHISRDLFR